MRKREYSYQNGLPAIDVELIGPKRTLLIVALVDSGAIFSLFKAQIAEILGIALEKGKKLELSGIGGKIKGYLHLVPVRVNGVKFECKIIFSKEMAENINLLGRDNFFLPFLITFNEKNQKILIEKHEKG